jgi:hypothetical protein
MRDELRENFGVKVRRNLDLRKNNMAGEASDYVVIGGSNAKEESGGAVGPDTAEKLCKQIVDAVEETIVVVIIVTDNLAYLVETEDGESHLPQQDANGHYHIDGQVTLVSAKQVRKVLQKLLPVLQLLKKNRKIILIG